ncbi:hypothetical protein FDP41_001765 [Naegleria fowleri]|uniref:Uncharacterized protein n=1 Tax=Naegleria fowleri TaxID=5763 RepID=A0A6A5BXQ3_NAEFO|nr:uncharacterized protein FDP41_001765 [Naegleria fowleri]KAF0979422.1 hypothetical protein FDP41_001765 [Naegleria fowleri]
MMRGSNSGASTETHRPISSPSNNKQQHPTQRVVMFNSSSSAMAVPTLSPSSWIGNSPHHHPPQTQPHHHGFMPQQHHHPQNVSSPTSKISNHLPPPSILTSSHHHPPSTRPMSAGQFRSNPRGQAASSSSNFQSRIPLRPLSASPNTIPFQLGGSESGAQPTKRTGKKQFPSGAASLASAETKTTTSNDPTETLTMSSSAVRTSKSDLDKPFHSLYSAYCRRVRMEPLDFIVMNSLSRAMFEVDLDLIPQEHWRKCLVALKNSRHHFHTIRLAWGQSNYVRDFSTLSKVSKGGASSSPSLLSIKESMMIHQMRNTNQLERKTSSRSINLVDPLEPADALKLSRILTPCFSGLLSKLELIGIPLTKQCTSFMQKGLLEARNSLRTLSLKNTALGDEAFKDIGSILTSFVKLSKVQISGCCLSDDSAQFIINMMRERENQKSHEAWLYSLRGEEECLDTVEDLIALDMSNNFFSDSTAKALAQILCEENTLKKLDLSKNIIGVTGISYFLDVVVHNERIDYINLSFNFGITEFSEKFESHKLFSNFFDTHEFIFHRMSKRNSKPKQSQTKNNSKNKKSSQKIKLNLPKQNSKQAPPDAPHVDFSPRSQETNDSGYESCTGRLEGNENRETPTEEELKKQEERSEKTLRLKRESELINMQIEFKAMHEQMTKLLKEKAENEAKISSQESTLTDLQQAVVQLSQLVKDLQSEKQSLSQQLTDATQKLDQLSKKRAPFCADVHIASSNHSSSNSSSTLNEDIACRLNELFSKGVQK